MAIEQLYKKELEPKKSDCPAIILVTDFGDNLAAAECRLSVISICQKQQVKPPELIEVNDISPFNIVHAAFTFCRLAENAPQNAVFIGVIDPGVGSERKSVIIKTKHNQCFVGPDNGIFYPTATQQGIETIWQIDEASFPSSSTTFHGRDIFSIAAAKIACNISPDTFAQKVNPNDLLQFQFQTNQIVHIDAYGNIKLSTRLSNGAKSISINLENQPFTIPITATFEDVDIGQPLAYLGSSGLLEIAVRECPNGGAAQLLGTKIGDCLNIEFLNQ